MIVIRSGWAEPLEVDLHPRRRSLDPSALQDQLLGLAQDDRASLYALFDAARTDEILEILIKGDMPHESLYRGREQERYLAVAPLLVALGQGSAMLGRWTSRGWGDSWGVLFTSTEPFDGLLSHFQQFILALVPTDRGEEKLFFRFHDPRTLRPFLPTCNAAELEALYGPVQRFLMESEAADAILVFDRHDRPAERAVPPAAKPADQRAGPGEEDNGSVVQDEPLLRIRPEQSAALQRALGHQFENRALARLRTRSAKRTASFRPPELRALVRAGIERARHHGIHVEAHVLRYLQYVLRYGAAFDSEQPWAREILDDRKLPGVMKMDRLARHERLQRGGGST